MRRGPSSITSPYQGRLYKAWARLFLDGRFTYATLDCAASHALAEMEAAGEAAVAALIPHEFVPGEAHGRREAGGVRMDLRLDAGGREEPLEALRERLRGYLDTRHGELKEACVAGAAKLTRAAK